MKAIKNVQRIIVVVFLIGVVVVALCRFDVAKITLKVELNNGVEAFNLPGHELRRSMIDQIEFDEKHIEIKNIKISRRFKSICLRTIDYMEFASLVDLEKTGSFQVMNDSLTFDNSDHVILYLNEAGQNELKKQASTLWLERIILAEVWGIVCALGLIVCQIASEKQKDNRYNHGPIAETKRFFADFKKYWQFMVFAARADLNAEVANSYLNRLWWLLEPLFSMIVYVVVFGGLMGRSIENYATYIFSSILMWNFFSRTISYSVKLVRNNRDIVSRVYVPKFVLLISNMMLNFFKLVFSWIILIPMLLFFQIHIGINFLWIIPAYMIMILISFGAGMILLHYGVYIDDLSYAVGILLQMLMFMSGVFYDVISTLAYPLNVIMISINPMAMLIDTMRNALLYNTASNLPLLAVWFFISILLCYLGVHIVYKNENAYVKVV